MSIPALIHSVRGVASPLRTNLTVSLSRSGCGIRPGIVPLTAIPRFVAQAAGAMRLSSRIQAGVASFVRALLLLLMQYPPCILGLCQIHREMIHRCPFLIERREGPAWFNGEIDESGGLSAQKLV